MCLRRDPSIAREKSINFDLFFHTWSDDRGPGPLVLSSDKSLKNNFKFIDPLKGHDEAVPQGLRSASLNPVATHTYRSYVTQHRRA